MEALLRLSSSGVRCLRVPTDAVVSLAGSATRAQATTARSVRGRHLHVAAACLELAEVLHHQDTRQRRHFSTSGKPQTIPPKRQKLPPNVYIDPRSIFAPIRLPAEGPDQAEDEAEGAANTEEADSDEPIAKTARLEAESTEFDGKTGEEQEAPDNSEDEEEEDGADGDLYLNIPTEGVAIPLPERLHVPVHTLFSENKATANDSEVGTIWLHEEVFGRDPIRVDLIKRAVNYIRAKKRGRRTAHAKGKRQVSGSRRKIRAQKGTGRARVGHSRPPHYRGGYVSHGPKNTVDYGKTKLNKKVRKLALCHTLSQRLAEGNVVIVNQLWDIPSVKTRECSRYLAAWNMGGKTGDRTMIIDSYLPEEGEEQKMSDGTVIHGHHGLPANFHLASSNIPRLLVVTDRLVNVYRIMLHKKIVITLEALRVLEERLSNI